MLDWIFEGAANWVASIMTQIMDAISGLFLEALGTDMTAMEEYFPFAVSAYTVVQYMAWALLFLVVAWQLFRAFGGPLTEAENPLHLLARGGIFAILITYAKPIFSLLLNIARAPYTALMDTSMTPSNFTFAGIQQVLSNGLTTIVSVATVVGLILLIILMIALAWNYFKLLLETVERYVLVGVLCYTSPLAYAMGASKATSRVFQSWCRMVGSQLLLLVLNVWFLRAFDSSVGQFIANGGALTSGQGSIFLWLFCALALLKIAQKCDSYLAARNGATLTAESVSSVASRPPKVSGTIAGDIADRSLPNYMPQMASGAAGNMEYTDTQITGGHISTKAVGPDGKQANVELFSAAQYDRPDSPHKQIQAADGSQWYQVASGEGRDAFYAAPNFTGDSSEAPQVSEAFPSAPQDTVLRTVDEGTMEARYPDGSNALWYSSAFYQGADNLFHTDPSTVDINAPSSITASFDDVSGVVSDCIQNGYDMALAQVEQIIVQGGYDRELSMEALINNGLISADYDTCYTLAAYSASMQQRGTTKADMKAKLDAVAGQMFAVTYEVKETTKTVVPEVQEGEEPGAPETVTVQYAVCTIHPFDQSVILTAFGIDTSTQYDQFNLTYGEAITNMSNALKMTMYGSLVGRVPYFWGGKSAPGWNEAWNTPRLVTSAGSSSTGTIRPYGLDCSGFTDWVYKTALGVSLLDGSWSQWDTTYAITEAELLPGDIGFMAAPGTVPVNHVLLYAGRSADGKQMWVHCSSSAGGVALNSPTYVTQFRRRKDIDLEADFTPAPIEQGVNDG